ncbi:MAG: 5-(carboxyamino)imidazole ribonucleotide synthase [Elainellaceae cyanobacterium]
MLRRVGVIGGGQLAAMMGDGAQRLGVDLIIQTPQALDPAVAIATETILAPVDDADATARLAERCDLITFENEFINVDALRPLENAGVRFHPRLDSLAPLLDKYDQRSFLKKLGLPTPQFTVINKRNVEDPETLATAIPFKFPVVLKARRHGYDGQGTFIVKSLDDLISVIRQSEVDSWLLEEFVPFERELAVMVARSGTGEILVYPVVETQQEHQVCRRVLVVNDIDLSVSAEVGAIARTLMDRLQVIGIFGIELFLTQSGDVLVNEIAPRTHNSGHYTLDACATSQFEQHLRAVCHLPLGNPHLRCQAAVMVNLLGYEYANQDYAHQRRQLAMLHQTFVHWYGKTESRPGRKLGHVTVLLDEPAVEQQRSQAVEITQKIEEIWYP